MDELLIAVSDAEHDVIILTETWLNDEINSLQLFGPIYNVFRNDRDQAISGKTRGGGVLIAVSNKLASKQRTCPILDLEQLWVNIRYGEMNICVGGVYLPPDLSSDANVIQKHIDSARAVANSLDPHSINLIFGDYNQPGLVWIQHPLAMLYPTLPNLPFQGPVSHFWMACVYSICYRCLRRGMYETERLTCFLLMPKLHQNVMFLKPMSRSLTLIRNTLLCELVYHVLSLFLLKKDLTTRSSTSLEPIFPDLKDLCLASIGIVYLTSPMMLTLL